MSLQPPNFEAAKARFKPMKRTAMKRRPIKSSAIPYGTNSLGPRKAINKRGARTKAWDAARAWLHRQFRLKGIFTCQIRFPGCWIDRDVYFAHPAKRRNLKEGELYVAAKACNPCHDQLEVMAPERMRSIVEAAFGSTGIVRKRA